MMVKGTLGILEEAAVKRLVHLPTAIAALRGTGIFLTEELVSAVLSRAHEKGSKS